MTCDVCGSHIEYCFYVNDEFWMKAVGRKEGYWCAHCVLQALGGSDWYITWCEPLERVRLAMESTDGY